MFFNSNYGDFALAWTKGAIKKLLFTVDHFCEMASSFASKLRFLDVSQTLNLKSTQIGELDVDLRDDPSDPVMRDKIMPYIREVRKVYDIIIVFKGYSYDNEPRAST